MLNSKALNLGRASIPDFDYRISMIPFNLDTLAGVRDDLRPLVATMTKHLKLKRGTAFLTADRKSIKQGQTHRRGGAHIDGNYLGLDWRTPDPGGGWKVGNDGSSLTKEQHQESYCSSTGGMLIISDYQACKGWEGIFDATARTGGSCEHLELDNGFWLQPLTVYQTTSQFIHQSMPVSENITRRLVRITLPADYPSLTA